MDDLSGAVDGLKHLMARPGTFETFFPETTDDMVLAVLVDAAAECHMEGLLLDYDISEDGFASPELSGGQVALISIFAAVRFLRAELINRNTNEVYEAGSAHYEFTQATNILRDILKGLIAQKERAIAAGATGAIDAAAAFFMADQYLARVCADAYPQTVHVGW